MEEEWFPDCPLKGRDIPHKRRVLVSKADIQVAHHSLLVFDLQRSQVVPIHNQQYEEKDGEHITPYGEQGLFPNDEQQPREVPDVVQ